MFALGIALIRIITVLFFIGLAGSAIVIVVSFVEDFRELFGSNDSASELPQPLTSVSPTNGIQAAPKQGAR